MTGTPKTGTAETGIPEKGTAETGIPEKGTPVTEAPEMGTLETVPGGAPRAVPATQSLPAPPRPAPLQRQPILQVRGLEVVFGGGVRAVRGLDLAVAPGEVVGIVGESGSGKSAAALAVMGLLPSSARVRGSVLLRGTELLGRSDRELARVRGRDLAMVFQDPQSAFTPVYSVGEQLAEAVRAHSGAARAQARARAIELLDLVGIPGAASRARAFPHEFSGGMLQRVMIAMAMANGPAVLIADEPTTALDVTVQAQVLEVLALAREQTGAALVLVTHDLGVVAGAADRVLVMYAGRVVESGTAEDVFYRPRMPYTIGLLAAVPRLDTARPVVPIAGSPPSAVAPPSGCAFAPRCPIAVPECVSAEPALRAVEAAEPVGPAEPLGPVEAAAAAAAAGAVGAVGASGEQTEPEPFTPVHAVACMRQVTDPAALYPAPPRPPARMPASLGLRALVLQVEGLVRHYPQSGGIRRRSGGVRAVDGISFEVHAGETLALVGESGCGKTTTLMEILALAAPQHGRISVLGRDVAGLSRASRRELRSDVQIVFQDPLAALDPRLPVADLLAEPLRTHGIRGREAAARVRELLDLVGLDPAHLGRYPQALSGGQRQRVGIARALALRPKLVVLDEPVSALDVSVQAGILNLLAVLKARLNLSYLVVAHDLAVVRCLADRVAVMYLGRIAELGEASQVYEAPAHPYTMALLSAAPVPDPRVERRRRRMVLRGEPPNPSAPPSGCLFHTRCPVFALLDEGRRRRCVEEWPEPRVVRGGVQVACHHTEVLNEVSRRPER